MDVLIEEHPLPPDTLGEPPKVSLAASGGEFASSTQPPTGPPTHAPDQK